MKLFQNIPQYVSSGTWDIKIDRKNTVKGNRIVDDIYLVDANNHLLSILDAGREVYAIPDSVRVIDSNAFNGCEYMKTVIIPNLVTVIKDQAFYTENSKLEYIILEGSVTPPTLEENALYGCNGLSFIYVPEEAVNDYKTAEVWNVYSDIICKRYQNLNEIWYKSTTEKNLVPGGGLIPISNKYINGMGIMVFGSEVTAIPENAFRENSSYTEIYLPAGVTTIYKRAFYQCVGLTSIKFPDSITTIEESAFESCTSLTSLGIPESVTQIGTGAFKLCISLSSITVSLGNPIYDSRNNCNAIVHTATNKLIFGCKDTIIPDSVVEIEDYAFYNCIRLTSIVIPGNVEIIGEHAFDKCYELTALTLENGVRILENYAFASCDKLTTLDLPDSVIGLPGQVFQFCNRLSTLKIGKSVDGITIYTFQDCQALTSITVSPENPIYDSRNNCNAIIRTEDNGLICGSNNTIIPEDVTCIETNAFYGRRELETINIPDSVTSIEAYAFCFCSGLTSITMGNNVETIEQKAFQCCFSLESFAMPDSVTSVGQYAFSNCESLTSVTLSNNLTRISPYMFNNCDLLSSIVIPDKVIIIDNSAFGGCDNLASVTIPSSVVTLSNYAFIGCKALEEIILPGPITTMGGRLFYDCYNLSSVTLNSITPPTLYSEVFINCSESLTIYVPAEYLETYKTAEEWSRYADKIQAKP